MRASLITLLSVAVAIAVSSPLVAQQKKQELQNVQGTVQNMSKENSTITVRTQGTATRTVAYDAKTKFMSGHSDDNKPGNLAQIKETYYISCAGTFDPKGQLMASQCVYRESK